MSPFDPINKIKGVLEEKKLEQFKVSSEFDDRLLGAIQKNESESSAETTPSYINGLANLFRRYAFVTVAMALVVFGGFFYYSQNSYSYHLNKAQSALTQLEAVISGNAYQASLIPVAVAQEEETAVDEALVVELTEEIVDETETAIEIAEDITDPDDVQEALEAISNIQDWEVEVFAKAVEVVESAEVTLLVAKALEITVEEQIMVESAADFVEEAIESGEDTVSINIETSEDIEENEADEEVKAFDEAAAQQSIEQTRTLIEELDIMGISEEEVKKIENKLEKIEEAIEDGKYGRVHGLSTAAEAQSKHLKKEQERAEEESEEDEEGEEEDDESNNDDEGSNDKDQEDEDSNDDDEEDKEDKNENSNNDDEKNKSDDDDSKEDDSKEE